MKLRLIINLLCLITCLSSCTDINQEREKQVLIDSIKRQITDQLKVNSSIKDSTDLLMQKCADHSIIPIHNSDKDTSILSFLRSLKLAVKNKNKEELLSLLDPGIISSHGGGLVGIKEFEQRWQLDKKPDQSEVWNHLERIIKLGGCFDMDENKPVFIMPYLQAAQYYTDCDYDWFSTGVCTKPDVYLYEKADQSSAILDTLNYRVLECGYEKQEVDSFLVVQTMDGKHKGFIKRKEIYFSADDMLVIEKKGGKWLIMSFAPFD